MARMAEDVLFDFLHMESVRLLYDKESNGKCSEVSYYNIIHVIFNL